MRFEIRYLPLAMQNLDQMTEYLLRFWINSNTMGRTLQKIEQKLPMLAEMSEMYEVYAPKPFYRRMVVGSYLAFYHMNGRQHTIEIYRDLRRSWDAKRQLLSDMKVS